jgi:hypothetical protein
MTICAGAREDRDRAAGTRVVAAAGAEAVVYSAFSPLGDVGWVGRGRVAGRRPRELLVCFLGGMELSLRMGTAAENIHVERAAPGLDSGVLYTGPYPALALKAVPDG